jgi:hypothetical protein
MFVVCCPDILEQSGAVRYYKRRIEVDNRSEAFEMYGVASHDIDMV